MAVGPQLRLGPDASAVAQALGLCGYARRPSFCCCSALCRAVLLPRRSVGGHAAADRRTGRHGVSHDDAIVRMGEIVSVGVLAYALGKLFLTASAIFGAAGSVF